MYFFYYSFRVAQSHFALLRLISRCSIRLRLASPDTERHNRGAEHDAQLRTKASILASCVCNPRNWGEQSVCTYY
jgi:hypothetical protein